MCIARARAARRARPCCGSRIANIHRPGALTPTVVLSLGLGLALLVTVIEIDGNLRRQFTRRAAGQGAVVLLPRHPGRRRPDASTTSSARRRRRAKLERVPMLRGRIVAANGIAAEDLKPTPDAAWVLQSDRGITYARRHAGGLAAGRGRMVERRTTGAAAGVVREADRRRSRPQARRSGHRQRARPQHHRDASPICAWSTGRASASIS